MKLKSLGKRPIVTVEATDSLQQAARLMRDHHVGALVVVQSGAEALQATGIVTDRDLAIEVLARGGDAAAVPVGRLAGGSIVSAPEDTELSDAVALMQDAGVRRLLVSDADGHLSGVVSFDDLLQACVAPLAGLAEVLRRGMEREIAERGSLAEPARSPIRVPAMGTAGWTGTFG